MWNKDFYLKLGGVDNKGKYSLVYGYESEKQQDETYLDSRYSFMRFVGDAHALVSTLDAGDTIKVTSSKIDQKKYTDGEGKPQFPKSPTFTVFKAELVRKKGQKKQTSQPATTAPDDDIPF